MPASLNPLASEAGRLSFRGAVGRADWGDLRLRIEVLSLVCWLGVELGCS
jgi:hypothetical protein